MKIASKPTLCRPLHVLFALMFFWACSKDYNTELSSTSTNQNISLEEIRAAYGHLGGYVQNRTDTRLPLDVIPLWDSSYFYNQAPFPIILTGVDTTTLHQDTRHGGNLAFFKDGQGVIQSMLLMWQADSLSPYASYRAPLDSTSLFYGTMLSVDNQDTIRKIAKLQAGMVVLAKSGALPANAIVSDSLVRNVVTERDEDGPKTGCRGPGCDSWWDNLLEVFGSVGTFFSNIWGDPGSMPSSSGGGYFFWGNYYPDFNNTNDWNPVSGGSGFINQEYNNFNATCAYIRQYIIAVEAFPPEYYQVNYRLCELMDGLGLGQQAGDEGFCLYMNQNSSSFEEIWSYWEASDKSPATADKIKNYLGARCTENPSILMAELVKNQFCLDENTIDLWTNLVNQCGYGFMPGSACVKNIVKEDRRDFFQTNYGITLSETQLVNLGLDGPGDLSCGLIQLAGKMDQASALLHIQSVLNLLEKENYSTDVRVFVGAHLEQMNVDAEYRDMVTASFGWPPILWTIAKELIGDALIDLILNKIPLFNQQDEVRDLVKSAKGGDWAEFAFEVSELVFKTLLKNNPWVKTLETIWEGSEKALKIGKLIKKVESLFNSIGQQAIERAWGILEKMGGKLWEIDLPKYIKYVDDVKFPKFGWATSTDWRTNFRNHFPDIPQADFDDMEVHHAIPRHIQNKYPGLGIPDGQIHSVENLRGISKKALTVGGDKIHVEIGRMWNDFYIANPNATLDDLKQHALLIDNLYGSFFNPPVR